MPSCLESSLTPSVIPSFPQFFNVTHRKKRRLEKCPGNEATSPYMQNMQVWGKMGTDNRDSMQYIKIVVVLSVTGGQWKQSDLQTQNAVSLTTKH